MNKRDQLRGLTLCMGLAFLIGAPALAFGRTHGHDGNSLANGSSPGKVQYIEDCASGYIITIAEDGTQYVCDLKNRLSYICKDGKIIDELRFDQGIAPETVSADNVMLSQQ